MIETHVNGPGDASRYRLTPLQRETLAMAFEAGYFKVPRRTTLTDLAAELDSSEQALSERLRRGLAALLTATGLEDTHESSDDHAT